MTSVLSSQRKKCFETFQGGSLPCPGVLGGCAPTAAASGRETRAYRCRDHVRHQCRGSPSSVRMEPHTGACNIAHGSAGVPCTWAAPATGMCPGSTALRASPSSSCTTLVFSLAEEVSPEHVRGCHSAAWALPVGTGEQHPGRVPQGHGLLPSAWEGLSSSCVGGDSRPCAGEMLSHRNNGKRPEMN